MLVTRVRTVVRQGASKEPKITKRSYCAAKATETASLVSTDWLKSNEKTGNLKILDATWFMPGPYAKDPTEEFEKDKIPGAIQFDIDKICKVYKTDYRPLPHMLPPVAEFVKAIKQMKIGTTDHIVVYDRSDKYLASARVWWMFRAFGFERVSVLNGGLKHFKKDIGDKWNPVESTATHLYDTNKKPSIVVDKGAILKNLKSKERIIVDARSKDRFDGTGVEPRLGSAKGHIPTSKNVPFTELVADDGLMKNTNQLKDIFEEHEVDTAAPMIATCGSGVSACVLALGLHQLGNPDVSVYDASWAEWGLPYNRLPIWTTYTKGDREPF